MTTKSERQFKIALAQLRKRRLDQQDELLQECRRALLMPKVNWSAIGREAGINGQTIRKLAYSETVRPQFVTVLAVLAALDYQITVTSPKQGVQQVLMARPNFMHRVERVRRQLSKSGVKTRRRA
jgi:DNA-binding phage protein